QQRVGQPHRNGVIFAGLTKPGAHRKAVVNADPVTHVQSLHFQALRSSLPAAVCPALTASGSHRAALTYGRRLICGAILVKLASIVLETARLTLLRWLINRSEIAV